jgi:hypothetical protein
MAEQLPTNPQQQSVEASLFDQLVNLNSGTRILRKYKSYMATILLASFLMTTSFIFTYRMFAFQDMTKVDILKLSNITFVNQTS